MNAPALDLAAQFATLGCALLQDAAPQYCIVFKHPPVARLKGALLAAPVYPVLTPNDMLPCLQALDEAEAGSALYIRNTAPDSHALMGDIFATAARAKGLAGVVVEGAVRDLDALQAIGLPVFSTEVTYVSAKTAVCKAVHLPHTIDVADYRPAFEPYDGVKRAAIQQGDWIFADSDGMLAIQKRYVTAVITAARLLHQREEALKSELRSGKPLGSLIGLQDFVAGRGDLRFAV
jgi:4-hydroxy-4-methyl-2-oxoglutarate aldolase